MPKRVVIDEAPFSTFHGRDNPGEMTYGQQLIAKLEGEGSGAQGAFYSDSPKYLSPEAHQWNLEGKGERYVALVARMDPTIRWYSPEL